MKGRAGTCSTPGQAALRDVSLPTKLCSASKGLQVHHQNFATPEQAMFTRSCIALSIFAALIVVTAPLDSITSQAVTLPTMRAGGASSAECHFLRNLSAGQVLFANLGMTATSPAAGTQLTTVLGTLHAFAPRSAADDNFRFAKPTSEDLRSLFAPQEGCDDHEVQNAIRTLTNSPGGSAFKVVENLALVLDSLRSSEANPMVAAFLHRTLINARAVLTEEEVRRRWLFPVRSREQATVFWRQEAFTLLGVGAVGASASGGTAYTELASPLLHAVRVSVSAIVAADEDETDSDDGDTAPDAPEANDAALSRFVTGGGLVNIGFALPAFVFKVPDEKFTTMLLLAPRFGATLPALGATKTDTTLLYDAGVELHLHSRDAVDGVGVLLQIRSAYSGGTSRFGELLGVSNGKDHFGYSTLSAGFLFAGKYMITASRSVLGPRSLRDRGWQVGLTAISAPTL